MTTAKTISYGDYLQVVGLFAVAREHSKALDHIERAAAKLVGEEDSDGHGYFGHVSDELYSRDIPNVDALMRRLGIAVEQS